MSRHTGTVILAAAAFVALVIGLALVLPEMRSAERYRARILATDLGELERRLALAPASDVAAVDALDRLLTPVFETESDGTSTARSRIRQTASVFTNDLEAWREERQTAGIFAPGAWPPGPEGLPTGEEMRRTVRLATVVEALGIDLRERAQGRILGVEPRHDEIEVSFEPERAGVLVDALTRLALGGEPFEVASLEVTIPDSGAGKALVRLSWPEADS